MFAIKRSSPHFARPISCSCAIFRSRTSVSCTETLSPCRVTLLDFHSTCAKLNLLDLLGFTISNIHLELLDIPAHHLVQCALTRRSFPLRLLGHLVKGKEKVFVILIEIYGERSI